MPQVQRLTQDRLHLQHGPIDVVLRAWGPPASVAAAEAAAVARFQSVLPELVAELPLLRRAADPAVRPQGDIARTMHAACLPHAARGFFVTPMAAVAGAVADALLAAMRAAAPDLARAFVNDGGDIAVLPGDGLDIGLAMDPRGGFDGALHLRAADGIGGIATSGRHGRSFSLGIADAVTVLARDAAAADVAATLIANAVDVQSSAITRRPAATLDPDSDLGERLVTMAVGALTAAEIEAALHAGATFAESCCQAGLIRAAALRLGGQFRLVGTPFLSLKAPSP
ncbi:UPF0280 family protein [Falsiroseomonas tokyonensis]|uniref:UPF0280 family protein n=1 Tax=Falsiroseomonas tokyonensis TaxID=430521 RepID=A0ABV7BY59_9PROT|nr:UPF0280 family protein [Falsiroseomonas tokyonensis]MBU8539350.1 UPF0280 family protein [Falsiroseomonas tokyonensis]